MAGKTIEISKPVQALVEKAKKAFAPAQIILFGSRARGDAFNHSDWDLLVISKKFEGVSFRERMDMFLSLIEKPIGQDIEAFCYTPRETEERKNQIGFIKTALETGTAL